MGRDTAEGLGLAQQQHGVERTASFERPDALEILALKEKIRPRQLVEHVAGEDRRTMNKRTNALVGGLDRLKIERLGHGEKQTHSAGKDQPGAKFTMFRARL